MKWQRACPGDQRGFMLTELMLAVAVMSLAMAGILVLQRGTQDAYLLGSSRVRTQQNARVALDLMTRELRSAKSISAIGSASDVTFVDQDGQTIQYALSDTTLNTTVNGTTTPLIGGVQSLEMTYYSVYDVSNNTYTTTTTPGSVKVIKISLLTQTEDGSATGSPGDQHARMECTIMLRAKLS